MKLLIVGCGSIGRRHAANAAGLAEVGLLDAEPGRAAGLAEEIAAQAFPDLDAALAWGPQAAVVAAPNDQHLPLARRLVEAGLHLLIEKPISHSLEGVAPLLEQAELRGCRLYVGCNMRYHPGPATLRAALPEIGRPLFARAHFGHYLPNMRPDRDYRELYCAQRARGGGTILDSIHELDYLAWLLGPVEQVSCAAGRLSDLEIDVEDYAGITLRHESAACSEVHLDYLQRFKRRGCEIVGSAGTLIWQSEGKSPERCSVRLHAEGAWRELQTSDAVDGNAPYAEMLRAFLEAVGGGGESERLLTARQARNDLAIALAALAAAESGSRQNVEWLR